MRHECMSNGVEAFICHPIQSGRAGYVADDPRQQLYIIEVASQGGFLR